MVVLLLRPSGLMYDNQFDAAARLHVHAASPFVTHRTSTLGMPRDGMAELTATLN